ncbi:MAG: hypothetical protein AAFU86_13045 [Pseudomonadota bacterium]
MTCETGNCPECIIRVGAMPTPVNIGTFPGSDYVQTYHLFIWYHDQGTDIIYRGGPAAGSRYEALAASGQAQQYSAPTRETGDIDWPFSNLVTNRMVGLDDDYDYNAWLANGAQARHMQVVAQGPRFCGLDEAFTLQTRRVGQLGRTYNAVDIDRTDNSNATVYTILDEMDLPKIKPAVHAPGWGTNLHRETTVIEDIRRPFEEIENEWNRFNALPALEQLNQLQRMFR